MQNKYIKILSCLVIALIYQTALLSIDNAHFYKASNLQMYQTNCKFDGKKHYYISDWYTKLDVNYGYGSTKNAWDHTGKSTTVLNRPGNQSILYFMQGVPDASTKYGMYNKYLRDGITKNAGTTTFGQLKFKGDFKLNEFNIDIKQNLTWGIFLEVQAPIRQFSIKNITCDDLSPETQASANLQDYTKTSSTWVAIKKDLNNILNTYNYENYNKPYSKTGFGDVTVYLGWQGYPGSNPEKDLYIGLELKTGLLCPAGSKINPNSVFSIPTGYNGHWGIPILGLIKLEYKKWLTLDCHVSSLFFFNNNVTRRLKSDTNQNGYIKLLTGQASEEEGILWHVGIDAKLDHIFGGLSLLVGYSYEKQDYDTLSELDSSFDHTTVNADTVLDEWYMNVLHFLVDYDFSVHMKKSKFAPRINVFYNYPFGARNSFKTSVFGGGLGADFRWSF